MVDAFYVPDGPDRFISTDNTIGPWDVAAQHGGPPAALLGRTIERVPAAAPMQVVRATFEILSPIPVAPVEVKAEPLRDGRNVQLVEATLACDDKPVVRSRAWRIRTEELDLDPIVAPGDPFPPPEAGRQPELFGPRGQTSYLASMEWRFVEGAFLEPGPAVVWARMRHPLVAGEEVTPLARVLIAADSGSGASSNLDFGRWLFINPDLTVYLHRYPAGEWVCLDVSTTIQDNGVGLARSAISDRDGAVGTGLQSLYVAPR